MNPLKDLRVWDFLNHDLSKNIIFYKKYDKPQTREQFFLMMENFVSYQKSEIESIKTIPTIMLNDGSRFGFSTKGLELLENIQEEIDQNFHDDY